MSNQPIVEIIEVEPRWITAQRVRDELVASERAAARESGLPTNFDRRDLDEWLDALQEARGRAGRSASTRAAAASAARAWCGLGCG